MDGIPGAGETAEVKNIALPEGRSLAPSTYVRQLKAATSTLASGDPTLSSDLGRDSHTWHTHAKIQMRT